MKQKILLLFPRERTDLYAFFKNDSKFDYYILNDEINKPRSFDLAPNFIKEEFYWNDYRTPFEFINKIKPKKIIFGEIFDIRQIALCIYANSNGVETFFLDHGATGDLKETIKVHSKLKKSIIINKVKNVFFRFFSVIKNRWFYYSNLPYVKKENLMPFLLLPFSSFIYSTFYALNKFPFKQRIASTNILFSQKSLEQANYTYHFPIDKTFLTGVPYFDEFYSKASQEGNYLVFVDTPFYEVNRYHWDAIHHKKLATALNDFAINKNIEIYIKLHPKSDKNLWLSYQLNSLVKIHQMVDFTDIYLKAKLIIGFSSSVMIGLLCAKKNIVLVGWNPKPEIYGEDFSKLGLCHSSLNIEDLHDKFETWVECNMCAKNQNSYNQFIKDYNTPFDGKATERIFNIILNV